MALTFVDAPIEEVDENEPQNVVYLDDKGGNSLRLQIFQGMYYHCYYRPTILRQIRSVRLRPDDVYFPAYLRTGTHWTFEMVSMLLNGKAETIPKYKGHNQLEFATNEDLNCLPSPRVITAHQWLSNAPTDLKKLKCKVIYPLRDPRDVAVSLYSAYVDCKFYVNKKGVFEDFLTLFLEGKVDMNGFFDHIRDAEKFFAENPDIPVHFMIYEETAKDTLQAVQNLSDFLELSRNDDLCRAIADKCKFSRMVVDKEPYSRKVDGKNVLYRKGIVGDWRNWFTEEMLEKYYSVYEEKMSGSRFYDRYAKQKLE
ncbi:amine sulfotransferase-like [Haliotis cracherodii]|uniref:amine sulfotransferase-like n=1 Tax=Haliotis cracherodii TaxID=6455 RepID=UPI0039EA0E4D